MSAMLTPDELTHLREIATANPPISMSWFDQDDILDELLDRRMIRISDTGSETRTYTYSATVIGRNYLRDIALLRPGSAQRLGFETPGSAERTPKFDTDDLFGGKP